MRLVAHMPVASCNGLIVLADPFTLNVEVLVRGMERDDPGVPILGGLATGESERAGNVFVSWNGCMDRRSSRGQAGRISWRATNRWAAPQLPARVLDWNLPDGSWPVEAYVPEPSLVDVVERYALEHGPVRRPGAAQRARAVAFSASTARRARSWSPPSTSPRGRRSTLSSSGVHAWPS